MRHQHRADVLVAEVELDLLVGPLDEERRVGVHDRAQAGQREPARDADHQLLADADVDHAIGVARRRPGRTAPPISASTSATRGSSSTSLGERVQERARAWWRGRVVVTVSPPSARRGDDRVRAAVRCGAVRAVVERVVVAPVDGHRRASPRRRTLGDAAGPAVRGGGVVDDDGGQPVRARTGRRTRSPRGWSPRRARRRRPARRRAAPPALGPQAERGADGQRQPVPERARPDLHAGHERPVRVVAEQRVGPGRSRRAQSSVEEARARRAPRSTPSGRGPWRAGTGRGPGRRGGRVDAEHAVVEHPAARRVWRSRWRRASRRRSSAPSAGRVRRGRSVVSSSS